MDAETKRIPRWRRRLDALLTHVALPVEHPEGCSRGRPSGRAALSGREPYPASRRRARKSVATTRQTDARNTKPLRGGGVPRHTCLPTVGLIVPVFGLALAPCWRSAGCRARHRASALSASLDLCAVRLGDSRAGNQWLLPGGFSCGRSRRKHSGHSKARPGLRRCAKKTKTAPSYRRGGQQTGHSSGRHLPPARSAHNPKVAGSNPAPATMSDEGLADAGAANPFRLPRLHPGNPFGIGALPFTHAGHPARRGVRSEMLTTRPTRGSCRSCRSS